MRHVTVEDESGRFLDPTAYLDLLPSFAAGAGEPWLRLSAQITERSVPNRVRGSQTRALIPHPRWG